MIHGINNIILCFYCSSLTKYHIFDSDINKYHIIDNQCFLKMKEYIRYESTHYMGKFVCLRCLKDALVIEEVNKD